MKSKHRMDCARRLRVALGRLFAAMVFLCTISAAPAHATVYTYIDAWFTGTSGTYVDGNGDYHVAEPSYNPQGSVIGMGITDGSSDGSYHELQVQTEITNPNTGYWNSGTGGVGYVGGTARVEVPLQFFGEEDTGTYEVDATYYSTCPFGNFGSNFLEIGIGIRWSSYQLIDYDGVRCYYTRSCLPGTFAYCGPTNWSAAPLPGATCLAPYARCGNITQYGVCIWLLSVCTATGGPTACT